MPAEVLFGGPGRQRRATVAFRLVLAAPQAAALAGLVAVAVPVAFAGWWAAMLTGRLPSGVASLLSGTVRFATRLCAYLGLLTDRYPPWTVGDVAYVVRVGNHPGPLQPLPVVFRSVLVLPAAVVAGVVAAGWALAAPFIWLAVLVSGRTPRSVFDATAAVLAYQARWWSYLLLLTPDYPGGLADPGRVSPPGRVLLGVFVTLGVLPGVGLAVSEASQFGSATASVDVRLSAASAYETAAAQMAGFERSGSGCSGPGELECRRAAARRLAAGVRRFGQQLRGLDFGSDVAAPAAAVEEDSDRLAATLDRMDEAADLPAYDRAASGGHLAGLAATLDSDWRSLDRALGGG